MENKEIEDLKKAVKEAKRIVFLGGAGVSTASGISDFRSPQGLYNIRSKYGVPYEVMLSHTYFKEHVETFYDFYWSTMVCESAKPNKAHMALASYQNRCKNLTIITQNIDGLDTMAGAKNVLEVHGSTYRYTCRRCGEKFTLPDLKHNGVPKCKCCGGIVKPDVVLYEEPLDEDILISAVNSVRFADLLIIGGTSMNVYPIAGLPEHFMGGKMAIINKEATSIDCRCDFVIHEDIGEVLSYVLGE